MALRNSRQDYGSVARVAHWATALFVLLAWPLGQFRDVFTRGAPRDAGLSVHMGGRDHLYLDGHAHWTRDIRFTP